MQGPARGPFVDLFFAFVKRILKQKAAVLEKVRFFEFVKVCLVYAFEQLNTIQPQFKKRRKEKKYM